MRVFVSYARRDNDETALREIEEQVRNLLPDGTPYIDDLHHGGHKRHQGLKLAFNESDAFVAVMSPWYLRTRWTRKEFRWAIKNKMAIHLIQKQDLTALAA